MNERRPRDPHVLPVEDPRKSRAVTSFAHSDEQFDRLRFAKKALSILQPSLRVAVYEGHSFEIDRSRPSGPRWAMVAIPKDVSRAHIAWALADLCGVANKPWLIDTLLHTEPQATPDAVRRVEPASRPS
ncbi:MAG: hypothetical protein IPJ34_10345 [Myxococcales bacterium]|nr:hypothetical protein [Myxococcales bacterium]